VHTTETWSAARRGALQLALVNRNTPEIADAGFRLHRIMPPLPVVFFTTYEDSDQLFKATPGGASAYLLRRTLPERLLEPIADAVNDKLLTRERVAACVRGYFHSVTVGLSVEDSVQEMGNLTHRENEILNLLTKAHADKEIAGALGISVWTVHGHLKRIFEKLGVHTRTEAAIKYLHK
jgi:DNA-binding NarL/FixJ family response regulator